MWGGTGVILWLPPAVPVKWPRGICMLTSSNGNIFRVTGHLCREFTVHRLIPLTKVSDVELWCFLWSAPERLSKQSWGWWFETPSGSLWRHRNGTSSICVNWHKAQQIKNRSHGSWGVLHVSPALRLFTSHQTQIAIALTLWGVSWVFLRKLTGY